MIMEKLTTKISFVEDRPDVMDFLATTFSETEDFNVLGQYKNAEEAIAFLPRSEPGVVLVDIGLPGQSGIECVRQVKALRPEIQFMMYTVFDKDDEIFESLKAGASGYLLKTTDEEKIIAAVRELLQGGAPMTPAIARRVTNFFFHGPNPLKELELLSPRELELLGLLSQGLLYREIAEEMNIVIGTVKQHIHNIYHKLHVSNRTEAVLKYLGKG